jgi:hypothetical protein
MRPTYMEKEKETRHLMVTAHAPVPRTACMHSLARTSMLCSCARPVALALALPEPRYGGGPTRQLPGGVEGHQWALEHNGRGSAMARQCGCTLSTAKWWIHGVGGVSGTVGIVSGLISAVGCRRGPARGGGGRGKVC